MSLLDIYSLPLFYISLKKKTKLENELNAAGFKDITMFNAVKGSEMDPTTLRKDNIISVRSYNDLITERQQQSGIPSLGAIGCSFSHYFLWKKCVEDNLDYITIVEDDINVQGSLSALDETNIRTVLSKDKGLFISPLYQPVKEPLYEFMGTHFYIASNSACKEMIKHMFPIDVQVDSYMANLKQLGYINLEGYPIYGQNLRYSGIQDLCLTCYIKNNNYQKFFTIFLLLYFLLSIFYYGWKLVRA